MTDPAPGEGGGGTEVLLALGSNLGDRLAHLRGGVRSVARFVRISALSPVVESPPLGVADADEQGDYLNAVLRGRTALSPGALLEACLGVEAARDRVRSRPRGPRTLDVDVLFYGDRVVERAELRIPHPRWSERGFVLVPLRAVAPAWLDPESGRTVEEVVREREGEGRLEGVRTVHPPGVLEPPAPGEPPIRAAAEKGSP